MINFRELFHSWSFNKSETKALYDDEVSKLRYVNGEFYWKLIGETTYVKGLLTTSVLAYVNGKGAYDNSYVLYDNGRFIFN